MFFTSNSSLTKIMQDIDDAQEAILKLCTDNMELLADEERSSFMDGLSSLSKSRVAAVNLRKNKKSTLAEVLREFDALKLRVQTMCMQRREDEIRRGGRRRVSPSTSATTKVRRQSSNPILNTAPPFEGSISDRPSSAATNGDIFYTAATQVPRQSNKSAINAHQFHSTATNDESWHTALSSSTPSIASNTPSTAQQTISSISTEDGPSASASNDIDSMVFEPNSSIGSPTFNVDSEGATGATHTYPSGSPSLMLPQAQQQPAARVYQSQAAREVKRERVMYFGSGAIVGSPTLNIRSPNATGTIEQVVP